MEHTPFVLAIGGNDPMGFSGIAADTKSICANGAHALSVISALTTQDSCKAYATNPIETALFEKQIDLVCKDSGVKTLKTGLLPTKAHIEVVCRIIERYEIGYVIVDPVMISSSGTMRIEEEAIEAYRHLFSKATLMTPNLIEAKRLLNKALQSDQMTKALAKKFMCNVLLKGGHDEGKMIYDTLYEILTEDISTFAHPKIKTNNLRGTGCTLASSIAANLSKGMQLKESVHKAIVYLQDIIKQSREYVTGKCSGALYHCTKESHER